MSRTCGLLGAGCEEGVSRDRWSGVEINPYERSNERISVLRDWASEDNGFSEQQHGVQTNPCVRNMKYNSRL